MYKYVTIESDEGEIKAYTEKENWKEAIDHEDTASWVWQFAETKEKAISQHVTKQDEWEANPTKETY